jgi:hypothetical protein
MSMIDQSIWQSVLGADAPFNNQAGIYRFWVQCRDQGQFLGVPITGEQAVSDGVIQQAFASGAVIQWDATNGAKLVSSS